MAVPAYATNLTDIITDMASTTGWTMISSGGGGANSMTAPETDDFIQGNNCISRNPWTSANIRGMVYNAATTITADEAVFIWWKADVAAALDTLANGGIQCLVGNSTTALKCYYVAGSDSYARGGWLCSPIDPTTTQSTSIGSPTTTTDYFGVRWAVPTSGPSKGFPYKIDAIRHGSSIDITAGEVANPATWTALGVYADDSTRRWGIVQPTPTGVTQQGVTNWGTASASVYSRDANKTIVLLDTLGFTSTSFTGIEFAHASTDVEWDNITFLTLDTTLNRGTIAISNNAAVSLTNCAFNDMNTFTDGGSLSVWDGSTWRGCNAITAAGGSFVGCNFLVPTVATDTSAMIYNETANPDTYIEGSTFTKGTNAHHAIEFGTASPTAMTLTDMTFTGFGADTTTSAALHFKRTTGTVTVTLDGTSQPTYKTDGATIVFVTGAVTVQVTAVTVTGTPVSGANVFLVATATTGSLPAEDVVTISNSGTTATVTHTGHGLATNDYVVIKGASHQANNGAFQITVTTANAYTYTMGSSPGSSPTGTIVSSFVFLYGTTNGSGIISMTRSIPAAQSVAGHARKGTGTPLYKSAPIAGTVSDSTGAALTGVMTLDE